MTLPENLHKYRYALIIFIAFLILFSAWVLTKSGNKGLENNPPSGNGQVNEQVFEALPALDEEVLKQFVKNFTELYNTYRYEDFSNLTALGDYQTPQMQEFTLQKISELKQYMKPGQAFYAEPDLASFAYTQVGSDIFTAKITYKILEYSNEFPEPENPGLRESSGPVLVKETVARWTLGLKKQAGGWLVESTGLILN